MVSKTRYIIYVYEIANLHILMEEYPDIEEDCWYGQEIDLLVFGFVKGEFDKKCNHKYIPNEVKLIIVNYLDLYEIWWDYESIEWDSD